MTPLPVKVQSARVRAEPGPVPPSVRIPMRKAVCALAMSALAFAASAQPVAPPAPPVQAAPAAIPQVSGVTVEGKVNGLPKAPCKERDKACIQQVVAALHALTGAEKEKFEIWCMANTMAQMRRGAYYGGGREDSGGNPVTSERSQGGDLGDGVQAACAETPKKHGNG
jgi:hypothetical protein